ncbi:MAG: hypothetical protein AABX35_00940 [Nanoarchaeota archaeon]
MGDKYNSKSPSRKEWARSIKVQNSDLRDIAGKLKKEIFKIESGRIKLSDREEEVISKIGEALKLLDYELIRKDETVLLYKKRELENSLKLISVNMDLLNENI